MATSATPGEILVIHNEAEHRFEARLLGELAVCDYERESNRLVFTHTFVPPGLRGRGIAETLVRAALDYARAQKLQIVPACSYVAAFVERHREFQALIA